ncbi:hypothetical protein [Prevotella jejuni]
MSNKRGICGGWCGGVGWVVCCCVYSWLLLCVLAAVSVAAWW